MAKDFAFNPHKITSVFGGGRERQPMQAITKEGKRYRLDAAALNHRLPSPGDTLDPTKHYEIKAHKDA